MKVILALVVFFAEVSRICHAEYRFGISVTFRNNKNKLSNNQPWGSGDWIKSRFVSYEITVNSESPSLQNSQKSTYSSTRTSYSRTITTADMELTDLLFGVDVKVNLKNYYISEDVLFSISSKDLFGSQGLPSIEGRYVTIYEQTLQPTGMYVKIRYNLYCKYDYATRKYLVVFDGKCYDTCPEGTRPVPLSRIVSECQACPPGTKFSNGECEECRRG